MPWAAVYQSAGLSWISPRRATATKGTLESIDPSGGDSKDDMTPCAVTGSKVANSHEHVTRLASVYPPEMRVLSKEQAHKRKREASLKSQQHKTRRDTEEKESTERIIQNLLADY